MLPRKWPMTTQQHRSRQAPKTRRSHLPRRPHQVRSLHLHPGHHRRTANRWEGAYTRLEGKELVVAPKPRPFVGVSPGVPSSVVSDLKEQGYIVEEGDSAVDCAVRLYTASPHTLIGEPGLIDCIEASPGPLVRYWRWPEGRKSALCLTGDLDALSLLDYAGRLLAS